MSSNIESAITYIRDHILLYEDSDDDVISKEVFLMILHDLDKMLVNELEMIDYNPFLDPEISGSKQSRKERIHKFIMDNQIDIYGNIDNPVVNRIYYIPETGEYYFCRDDNALEKI